MNDNVNENDYYKDEIIFETLAGSQAVRNLRIPEWVNKQSDEKKGLILWRGCYFTGWQLAIRYITLRR
ncbi:hypothetical protein UX056_07795 [Escherichia coli]|nr:hypothetical protein [Escherichia coli]MDY8097878.1 hypothetical protein [Escherichia coli]HBC5790384.1 hypothetical protein [Escherichia coli]HDJ8551056.1 hypothetical protein [Escherichia coli]